MGSQAKTQPLSPGASNPGEGQSALQSLMGQPSASSGQPTAGSGGGNGQEQMLQQYLTALLGKSGGGGM